MEITKTKISQLAENLTITGYSATLYSGMHVVALGNGTTIIEAVNNAWSDLQQTIETKKLQEKVG